MVKIRATPVELIIIQTTRDHENNGIDEVYECIEELLRTDEGKNYFIVMGDFNAIVGEEEQGKEIGKYWLSKKMKKTTY